MLTNSCNQTQLNALKHKQSKSNMFITGMYEDFISLEFPDVHLTW